MKKCIFTLFLMVGSLFAFEKCCECGELFPGGFWIGVNHADYVGKDFCIMVGSYTEHLAVGLGACYIHDQPPSPAVSTGLIEVRSHLGWRYRLGCNNLFFNTGGLGAVQPRTASRAAAYQNPFAVGGYVGLDFMPIRHFMVSGKLAVYSYERTFDNDQQNSILSNGDFTFALIF